MELSSEEGRVLGCLAEKQLTTPNLYPLTENALIAACNQMTNRDPVVAYDVSTVRKAVRSLRDKGLLRTVHRAGERSDKHRHLLDSSLALPPGQVSLLAVLLLRGPQTLGELRARTERMHPFETPVQLQEALDALTGRGDPLVVRLDRQPGRKESRYGQLLVDDEGRPGPPSVPAAPEVVQAGQAQVGHAQVGPVQVGPGHLGLAREVELLRDEVADLRRQVDRLRERTEKD